MTISTDSVARPIKPYVGITGFTHSSEVRELLDAMAQMGFPETHQLMVGVLVSDTTMRGELPGPRWINKYPDSVRANEIWVDNPRAFNVVHYNTKGAELAAELMAVMRRVPQAQGIQLNIAWPNPRELAKFRAAYPDVVIIMQVGPRALEIADCLPDVARVNANALRNRIGPYAGAIDYFLVDTSAGEGRPFDPDYGQRVIEAMHYLMDYGVLPGIAGGLEAETVSILLATLAANYPGLCWDAEGRLRTADRLDLAKCVDYLRASARLLGVSV